MLQGPGTWFLPSIFWDIWSMIQLRVFCSLVLHILFWKFSLVLTEQLALLLVRVLVDSLFHWVVVLSVGKRSSNKQSPYPQLKQSIKHSAWPLMRSLGCCVYLVILDCIFPLLCVYIVTTKSLEHCSQSYYAWENQAHRAWLPFYSWEVGC